MAEADAAARERVRQLIPQKPPFHFIDEITSLNADSIRARYRLPGAEAWFYRGHFPERPITPGVILIEIMAQTAVVALGVYNFILMNEDLNQLSVFAECEMEFSQMVLPETVLIVSGEKEYLRRGKLKSLCNMELEDGTLVASGALSGVAIQR
ncbi:MAG: beta-hydroxyacyl-ACP dehydratase [Spirochaetales bacterium]|nr:beta-hydroxyacyl-ACP dehydratase [Spirochaetales bacterium]